MNSHPLVNVKVKTLEHFKGELPIYHSLLASGLDVRAQISQALLVAPLDRVLVSTALCFEIPSAYEIQVRSRSGWAYKKGISVLNSPGTIDADYRGELKIILVNLSNQEVSISPQDRIAQLILAPVVQINWKMDTNLSATQRGEKGFGSTGLSHD
ncbi:MAG: dUTP diphosphatase [Bdellovibrionaceae bacterium]|nr:dUTP diphosphatase [Pseudobdellovibrionaceae bacterium]